MRGRRCARSSPPTWPAPTSSSSRPTRNSTCSATRSRRATKRWRCNATATTAWTPRRARPSTTGPAVIGSIAASLAQPLIGLKAIEANVESKTATRDQLVVTYQQTVQTAFKETHDALVANQTMRDALAAQTERRTKLERALDLAGLRYRSGYSPYLEVLDVQRQLLQAQTQQIF